MRFRTTILQSDKTATGIEVPPAVVEQLGAGKRPPVRVTINGFTYRSTIAVMGGAFMVGVSAENRAGAGVKGGDEVDVTVEIDEAPRVLELPEEFAVALRDAGVLEKFQALSYSKQNSFVAPWSAAKSDATRDKNLAKAIAAVS